MHHVKLPLRIQLVISKKSSRDLKLEPRYPMVTLMQKQQFGFLPLKLGIYILLHCLVSLTSHIGSVQVLEAREILACVSRNIV